MEAESWPGNGRIIAVGQERGCVAAPPKPATPKRKGRYQNFSIDKDLIDWGLLRVLKPRPSAWPVLTVLIRWRDKGGWVNSSIRQICNDTGLSRGAIAATLNWLETKRVIEVNRGHRRHGNRYRIRTADELENDQVFVLPR